MILNINYDNNSDELLFSIPVHEEQDIINNQIENILNFNPNAKIILHINKSFTNFDINKTSYNNVYINSNRFNYTFGKGLLWIHINNFIEACNIGINFKYIIILSSNEMFIKYGLNKYVNKHKNGLQIEKFDLNNDWHNFNKGLEKNPLIINLLKEINLNQFYGGQTEGQFYEKNVFNKIKDIYLKIFGNSELNNFETEEIVIQTIFKSFNLKYGLPITLQNYSNKIKFNEKIIEKLINNSYIIENNKIKNNLISPHIGENGSSIFSIKRIKRNFNNNRKYLSRKGFILNESNIYQLNTYYYSNTSTLFIHDNNHISFKKYSKKKLDYQWFGYNINKGYYNISFDIKINININNFENIGIKIHNPHHVIYNYFFYEYSNEWLNVKFPLNILENDKLIFIFDDATDIIDIEIKNFKYELLNDINKKENIALCLYEKNINNINYKINYKNIYNNIIIPLEQIYNIYIFNTIYEQEYKISTLRNLYKPYHVNYINQHDMVYINDIFIININSVNNFIDETNIQFKFFILFILY
jgi:hypothetical protein